MRNDEKERLARQLMHDEGREIDSAGMHVAYRCPAGKLTIGYGHNLDANPVPGLGENSRISEDQAQRLLHADIDAVEKDVTRKLPWARSLSAARQGVLINMAFNLGMTGLLGFKNTLADIQRGNFAGAAKRMLQSKWAAQVGRRAIRLSRQMETGRWQ